MNPNYTCPRCQQIISDIRRYQTPSVCDNCGFVVSQSEKREEKNSERTMIVAGVSFGILMLAMMYHIGSWGSYSLEIVPLKIGHIFHTSTAKDIERSVEIGMDLRNYDLVEVSYRALSERVNLDNYVRLAKFQYSRGKFIDAVETYRKYFAMGKNSLESRYDFARALAEAGYIDEAAKNFDYVLRAKPGVRQVTVLQKYVTALVKAQRYDQAQNVIERVRLQDPTAASFMDTEYKVISERKKSSRS